MDFNERMIPGVSAQFLYYEAVARYEFAKKFIKPGIKILDAACGTGYGSSILARDAEVAVTGIDRDKDAIAYCKKNFGNRNIKFGVQDLENINKKNKYNLITAMEIIEHLDDGLKFAQSMRTLLAKKGILVVSTPNAKIVKKSKLPKSPYHEHEYELKEFISLFEKAGFEKCLIYGQNKNKKASMAFKEFLESQQVRQNLVDRDILGFRKLLPLGFKEYFWKHVAKFFGGKKQYELSATDFPIKKLSSKDLENAEYFVVVCQ